MIGIAGRALHQSARYFLAFVGLWLLLSVACTPTTAVFAQDTAQSIQLAPNSDTGTYAPTPQMCTQPVQSCGCATCGCCGGSCGGGSVPSCPPGSHRYDDYCLPDCPTGFTRYPGLPGLCMPPCQHGCPEGYDQVPLPECPENYVRDLRNPDRCIPDYDRMRNYDSCPEGMNWSSETGQCEYDCPDNFYRDLTGQCRFVYERDCGKGYTRDLRNGKCVPEGDWPVTYRWICLPACPQGTYRDIRYPTRCLPPPPQCDDGYELRGGHCVPICEPGTQQDRYGYCVPQTCPDGQYPDIRGNCRDPDCPFGYQRDRDGNCAPPDDSCPGDQVRVRGECVPPCGTNEERDENGRCMPVDEGCRQGEEEVNGECKPICKIGQRRDARGNCVPERQGCAKGTVPFKGTCVDICKEGQRRNADGRCVTVERKCPEGSVRVKNGGCLRIPTEVICGKGYKPDGKGNCIRIIRLPKVCPPRTQLNPFTNSCDPIRRKVPQPQGDTGDNGDDGDNGDVQEPPRIRTFNPNIQINPGLIEQLVPRKKPRGANIQKDCPEGFYRDNNGRCVQG